MEFDMEYHLQRAPKQIMTVATLAAMVSSRDQPCYSSDVLRAARRFRWTVFEIGGNLHVKAA